MKLTPFADLLIVIVYLNITSDSVTVLLYVYIHSASCATVRPGPDIPLNLPIIQITYIHPIIQEKVTYYIKKMQMKHEYDQDVHDTF